MTKAPISLQELRRRIYRKAKSDKTHRFWGLFVHVTKIETLEEAYRIAKSNGGAAGVDGQKFSDIESAGRSAFLASVREDLITDRYKPMPNRRVEIPKGNGKVRTLQIPCIRDRVVQGAVKLILEAVFEADALKGEAFGFLGFDLRRVRKRNGDGYFVLMTPKKKARTAVKAKDPRHHQARGRNPHAGTGEANQRHARWVGQLFQGG